MKSCLLVLFVVICNLSFAQFTDIETPHRIGGEVNTIYEENFPIFSRETSTLYFSKSFDSSSIGGYNDQDIWQSERLEDKDYSKGGELHALNNKFNNCIVGFNADESRVYLLGAYHGKKDLKKGIAFADRKGNGWSAPHDLKIPDLDIEGSFYGFHINRESNTIIISFDGPDSKGKEDLYFSQLIDDKWTSPASLGSNVNSSGYEISPFLSDNDDTLYFASNGFGGFGDADIFYSVRTGESWDSWSEPVNLGEVINTPKFDAYFTIFDHFFYWSSNRDSEMSDIYYSSFLPAPPLFASAEGTDAANQTVEVEVPINQPDEIIEIVEVKKEPIETIIYFDLNSSFHNSKNTSTLKEFVGDVSDKKGVRLSVVSHCDRRDTKSYNIWLSKKRMERTINYLVSNGFDRSLITGGYKGEDEPDVICDSCTEDQFTKNRRTVIQVID